MRTAFSVLFAIFVTGCGTIVVDDVTVMEDDYARSRDQVLRLASGELACPREQLATKVLAVDVHADVRRLAVKGCGKDVVYGRSGDAFAVETSPPPPEK